MPEFPMDPSKLADLIGIPLKNWTGNCHGVAEAVLRKAPVRDMRLVRGHYHGYIHRQSVYLQGPQQHSWLELADGRILDPTRWAMDRPDTPSIFLGPDEELDYDEGGLYLRAKDHVYEAMADHLFGPMKNGPADVILKKFGETDIRTVQDMFVAGGLQAPAGVADRQDAQRLYDRFYDPVEHFATPEPFFAAVKQMGLAALVPIDTMRRVLEPELVCVDPQSDPFYDLPEAPELTSNQQLFKVFCRFLSVEFREMTIESELEELGYRLDDLHDMLNKFEYALRLDPEDPYLSGNVASGLAVIAGDLLGKGYGAELQVERYAKSYGMSRQALHDELAAFGARSGYDLQWLTPSECQSKENEDGVAPTF
jgi:hypothetical protein